MSSVTFPNEAKLISGMVVWLSEIEPIFLGIPEKCRGFAGQIPDWARARRCRLGGSATAFGSRRRALTAPQTPASPQRHEGGGEAAAHPGHDARPRDHVVA